MLYLRVLLTDPFLVHTFFGVLRLCKGDLWQSLNNRHEESHSLDFLQARLPYRLSGKKHKLTFNQLLLWKKDESQNLFSCYFYNACTCVPIWPGVFSCTTVFCLLVYLGYVAFIQGNLQLQMTLGMCTAHQQT